MTSGVDTYSTIAALQRVGVLMSMKMMIFGLLFIGPQSFLLEPKTPPDAWWMSLDIWQGFSVWDVLFPLVAALLFLSIVKLKRVWCAHYLAGVTWVIMGALWTLGGILYPPSPFFGVGMMSIFVGILHILLAQVWFFEGIE